MSQNQAGSNRSMRQPQTQRQMQVQPQVQPQMQPQMQFQMQAVPNNSRAYQPSMHSTDRSTASSINQQAFNHNATVTPAQQMNQQATGQATAARQVPMANVKPELYR